MRLSILFIRVRPSAHRCVRHRGSIVGRQLQLLMDASDEKNLISFLRSTASIQIFESFAPSTDELWVDGFNSSFVGHHAYVIWNQGFEWQPEYGTVGPQAYDPHHIGWRYIANKSAAPILQVSRTNPISGQSGRLYWAKDFSAPNGLAYDVVAFGKWVDSIWRWIRKHGNKASELPLEPYILPGAMERLLPNE